MDSGNISFLGKEITSEINRIFYRVNLKEGVGYINTLFPIVQKHVRFIGDAFRYECVSVWLSLLFMSLSCDELAFCLGSTLPLATYPGSLCQY